MPAPKTDRDQIVDVAGRLFRDYGYERTSVADVAEGCGLLKGSLYYHFRSKETLAVAVIERAIVEAWDGFLWLAYEEARPMPDRARAFALALRRHYGDRAGRCVLARLAMEIGADKPLFALPLRRYFEDLATALAVFLPAAQDDGATSSLRARVYVERLQGAFILANVANDSDILDRIVLSFLTDTQDCPGSTGRTSEQEEPPLSGTAGDSSPSGLQVASSAIGPTAR